MSDRVYVVPTKFVDVRTNEESFGYRIGDCLAQSYDTSWPSIPDDDLEFLELVKEVGDQTTEDLLESCRGKGMFIGNRWYEWSEVEHIMDAEPDYDDDGDPMIYLEDDTEEVDFDE